MKPAGFSPIHLGIKSAFSVPLNVPHSSIPTTPTSSFNISHYRTAWDVTAPPPKVRLFLVGNGGQGLIPLGKTSVLGGFGGSMKTAMMIMLALHVGAGTSWDGHQVDPGAVLMISMEDDADEMNRRLIATATAEFPISAHQLQQHRVRVIAMPGIDGRVTANFQGTPVRSNFPAGVIEEVRDLAAASGLPVKLVVFDHARLCIGGDLNASEDVTAGMSALTHIAEQTGAAVVLLCHSPKASAANNRTSDFGMADILGSGAFVDNARFAAIITALDDKERKAFGYDSNTAKPFLAFRVIKSNYSESGRTVYMQKTPVPNWGVAYPKPVQLYAPLKPVAGASATVAQRVYDFIKASPGRYSRTKVRDLAGKDGALQASEREVRSAIDQLFADRRIEEKEPSAADIREWGVRKRDKVLYAI